MVARAPFQWIGGKSRLVKWLRMNIPEDTYAYIEPFYGSGALHLSRPKLPHEVINDRNGSIVAFFRAMRDMPDELRWACVHTPWSREEWEAIRDAPPVDDTLETARRWFVAAWQSFIRGEMSTWWNNNVSTPGARPATHSMMAAINRFAACSERLQGCIIENADAVYVIKNNSKPTGTSRVLYCDPPYPMDTRKAEVYEHDEMDHEALLAVCIDFPGFVAISSYPGALYDAALLKRGWTRIDKSATMTMANTPAGDPRSARVECLYMNQSIRPRMF